MIPVVRVLKLRSTSTMFCAAIKISVALARAWSAMASASAARPSITTVAFSSSDTAVCRPRFVSTTSVTAVWYAASVTLYEFPA